jgi:DNA-binding beta-propeller fold protein YncE
VVNNTDPGSVTVVGTGDRQVLNTIGVGTCPTSVAVTQGGHQAYVTNTGVGAICASEGNTVSVLSTQADN